MEPMGLLISSNILIKKILAEKLLDAVCTRLYSGSINSP